MSWHAVGYGRMSFPSRSNSVSGDTVLMWMMHGLWRPHSLIISTVLPLTWIHCICRSFCSNWFADRNKTVNADIIADLCNCRPYLLQDSK